MVSISPSSTRTRPAVEDARRPQQVRGIAEYEVEDEVVLFDPRSDTTHVLNPTAAVVWWLCDGERTPEGISLEVAGLYDVPVEAVREDVRQTLSLLRRSNLVRWL